MTWWMRTRGVASCVIIVFLGCSDDGDGAGGSGDAGSDGTVCIGLAEEPTLVRCVPEEGGDLVVDASLSLQRYGLVAVAADDRWVAASQPAVGPDGAIYVMGDGRNYLTQLIAMQRVFEPPSTCVVRIPEGETSFDPDFYVGEKERRTIDGLV